MEKKTKKELLTLIEEQNKNLQKYKSRLHDIVESYKNLVKEKETLENSIKTLTEVGGLPKSEDDSTCSDELNTSESKPSSEKRNDNCLQKLRSSLGALTVEKSRIENELRADRKKLLQQKEELERSAVESEKHWLNEKEKYENSIHELRKKVTIQQREREKEQQDHVLMLKELQNVLASERASKERLEQQVSEVQQRFSMKIPEKKVLEYEKTIEELQNRLTVSQDRLRASENESKKAAAILKNFKEEMNEMKSQYLAKINEEKKRTDLTDEKLKLLTFVKEKRIATLESRISELSTIVGEHDKLRQHDQITIQKLKARISQLQVECSAFAHVPNDGCKFWEYSEPSSGIPDQEALIHLPNVSELSYGGSEDLLKADIDKDFASGKIHAHCQAELIQIREELEQYKSKAESALKEKYSKTSAALLSDAKAGKEIKELRSRMSQLQDQLQTCKSQLKLNEEYHNKITANLEKSSEDLKIQQKQELAQIELSHRNQRLELEHQIQKQRERTLLLLEEKDKEIGLLKSSFLSSFVKKDKLPECAILEENIEPTTTDHEVATSLLSTSLISSKKDGHILHYIQELARKDIEISNLRHSRIQTESSLRKLQQSLALIEEKYHHEVEAFNSRIKLLEGSQDKEGTNVEYLKNVVLRFLKCSDPNSRRHMVNAIATVLHFTSSEVQNIKMFI